MAFANCHPKTVLRHLGRGCGDQVLRNGTGYQITVAHSMAHF